MSYEQEDEACFQPQQDNQENIGSVDLDSSSCCNIQNKTQNLLGSSSSITSFSTRSMTFVQKTTYPPSFE